MTQDFVTHRCSQRPTGIGMRKYIAPQRMWYGYERGVWYLFSTDYDTEWDAYLYMRVCAIKFCPFCGCKLESGVSK